MTRLIEAMISSIEGSGIEGSGIEGSSIAGSGVMGSDSADSGAEIPGPLDCGWSLASDIGGTGKKLALPLN